MFAMVAVVAVAMLVAGAFSATAPAPAGGQAPLVLASEVQFHVNSTNESGVVYVATAKATLPWSGGIEWAVPTHHGTCSGAGKGAAVQVWLGVGDWNSTGGVRAGTISTCDGKTFSQAVFYQVGSQPVVSVAFTPASGADASARVTANATSFGAAVCADSTAASGETCVGLAVQGKLASLSMEFMASLASPSTPLADFKEVKGNSCFLDHKSKPDSGLCGWSDTGAKPATRQGAVTMNTPGGAAIATPEVFSNEQLYVTWAGYGP